MEYYAHLIEIPEAAWFLIKSSVILLGLSWLLLITSKIVFKKAFSNQFWKYFFLTALAFPSVIQIYLAGLDAVGALGPYAVNLDLSGYPSSQNFDLVFFPLFAVYFTAFLIHFIVRLVRSRKDSSIGRKQGVC